jgi:diacylglycerol kinase family enzyme
MHNPTAGDERHSKESLIAILAEAGHEVMYQSIDDEDWREALRDETDLVVVVGGDGTVRKVFKELAGKKTPVTLFPVGSANNIARTLGFEHDDAARLAAGWSKGSLRPYDLGRAELPSGATWFVESMGSGIFAEVLARAKQPNGNPGGRDKVKLGLRLLREVVLEAPRLRFEVELNELDLSTELLAIEGMNVRETGPNVLLAPEADPGDGLLDFVFVKEEDRAALIAYVDARLEDRPTEPLGLHVQRGRRASLRAPEGAPVRVDDEVLADRDEIPTASASIDGTQLTVLFPAAR